MKKRFSTIAFLTVVLLMAGCSSDEDSLTPPPYAPTTLGLAFENPLKIEVDPVAKRALLLHGSDASSGTALQLVDLEHRRVMATFILIDYFDVYDIAFVSVDKACFAGRPHGHRGYGVQFFSLPDLVLGTLVMTADTAGSAGFLAVDSAHGFVYYTHAGGGAKDGIYRIATASETLVDADRDGAAPYALDNGLVANTFSHPTRVFYDDASRKLVIGNLDDDYVTIIDDSLWGRLDRNAGHSFPVDGLSHLNTASGGVAVRADAMGYGAGVYVMADVVNSVATLARFGVQSLGLDLTVSLPDHDWKYRCRDLHVDPREDVVSLFVLQQDSIGEGIGQFRLNNLVPTAKSPYRARVIPDSLICAMSVCPSMSEIIVADKRTPRLEIIGME